MSDRPFGDPGSVSARPAADLEPADGPALAARLARCRQAFQAGAEGSVQLVDLTRLRRSLGSRWPELRRRVLNVAGTTLARGLAPDELCVPGGEDRLYLLRVGPDRREHARQGELLAAEATARLCGAIPGGAGIHVRTLPIDLDTALADVDSLAELQARLAAAAEAPRPAAPSAHAAFVDRLEPRFRPLLNPRKRLVSAYHLAHDTDGPALWRKSAQDDALAAELDGWSLRQAATLLAPARGRGRAGLIVPVHYSLLATMRWREPFTQLCRRLPLGAGRRLIFEVLGLPQGLPQPRVRELMAYIRPFCATLVVRLPPGPPRIEHLASSGVRGLSLAAVGPDGDERATPADVAALVATARAVGMRSLLVGIDSAGTARAALSVGVDHAGGDALIPALRRFGPPILLPAPR